VEVQVLPFVSWSVVTAGVFAAAAFAYLAYLKKRKSIPG